MARASVAGPDSLALDDGLGAGHEDDVGVRRERGDRCAGGVVVDLHDLLAAVPRPLELDARVEGGAARRLHARDVGAEVAEQRSRQARGHARADRAHAEGDLDHAEPRKGRGRASSSAAGRRSCAR